MWRGFAHFFCLVLQVVFLPVISAQDRVVSGFIVDGQNGESLPGAYVTDTISGRGAMANQYGFFSITVSEKRAILEFGFLGYKSFFLDSVPSQKTNLRVELIRVPFELEPVNITDIRERDAPIGYLSVPVSKILTIPSLLGEPDVLKALTFTPGVMVGAEGSAGLFVRGGSPDQNLILLDEAPVYNVMHLGGIVSVFNPSALKSVNLYKSYFPARYGGRLSSVIDLTMKDGNNKKLTGEVGVGIVNQKLTVESPLGEGKGAVIFSGRYSTLGITKLLARNPRNSNSGRNESYQFYDFNVKLNYRLSEKDHIYLSAYNGYDFFRRRAWDYSDSENAYGNSNRLSWGNTTGTARYTRTISSKLFFKSIFIFSRYSNLLSIENKSGRPEGEGLKTSYYRTLSSLNDYTLKFSFDYYVKPSWKTGFGVEVGSGSYHPLSVRTNLSNEDNRIAHQRIRKADLFLDNTLSLTPWAQLEAGIRFTTFGTVDTATKWYKNLEPRLGAQLELGSDWTLKGGFSVMNQYLHLLTNSGLGFGYDIWLPSSSQLPPSRAEHLSFGVFKTFKTPGIDVSLEVYQKKLSRLIDYREGVRFNTLFGERWENVVSSDGIGRGHGLEMMVARNKGRFTASIAYTLSKHDRKFGSINEGKWFPFKYDRRHSLSVFANLNISEKWQINSTFVFYTGSAITLPIQAYIEENGTEISYLYGPRNNGRMPVYHRMDLGVVRNLKTKRGRNAQLSFGVYNLLNRNNPYYMDLSVHYKMPEYKPARIDPEVHGLFPILPYIGYTLKF